MQASSTGQLFKTQMGAAKVLYAILVTTLLLFWLNQNSISLYCQQKYHQSCELPWVGQSQAWRLGGNLTQALGDARSSFIDSLERQTLLAQAEVRPIGLGAEGDAKAAAAADALDLAAAFSPAAGGAGHKAHAFMAEHGRRIGRHHADRRDALALQLCGDGAGLGGGIDHQPLGSCLPHSSPAMPQGWQRRR